MKIVRAIVLGDEDAVVVKEITESCNQAINFFTENEQKRLARLTSGNSLSEMQLEELLDAIESALIAIANRTPHEFFLQETKQQYSGDLYAARTVITNWLLSLNPRHSIIGFCANRDKCKEELAYENRHKSLVL